MKARLCVVNVSPGQPPVFVLIGSSSCGKSTMAALLAGRLGWDSRRVMTCTPRPVSTRWPPRHRLCDQDRWPWPATVADLIGGCVDAGPPGLITCSALKKSSREVLRGERVVSSIWLAPVSRSRAGLAARHGHYMPASLLGSQFNALEPPTPEENSITVEIGASTRVETDAIMKRLGLLPTGSTQAGK
jgi:gluconokinase